MILPTCQLVYSGSLTDDRFPQPKDLTPDEEKIKSLQGWLLKCGVCKQHLVSAYDITDHFERFARFGRGN
jgi:hypothetical protein